MRVRNLGVVVLLLGLVALAACRPVTPPPPPPPPRGGLSLGWSASGVNGPIAADPADNAVWAMNKGSGTLDELNATTGAVMHSASVPLSGAQHFPTPEVASGWAVIERSGNTVFGMKTDGTASWTSSVLDGLVQARPLVVNSVVVVATENDSLYGLDLTTGAKVWGPTSIGVAEPLAEVRALNGNHLSGCGDIDPLGITSNPVLGSNGDVYAVGERETGATSPHTPEHVLAAVDPATGSETLTPKNVDVPAMTEIGAEQQRAGLAAANGNIYVGFGGLVGDCGTYHGFVVAAQQSDGTVVGSFEAAAVSNAAAVWGTSGPVADASGNVYATTGNSQGTSNSVPTDYSDGVVRLSPTMSGATTVPADYFQPPAWRSDNAGDLDLGSTGPVLLPNGTQLFVIGKQHTAFLLSTSSLGGADHETPLGSLSMCSSMAFGQNVAMSNTTLYVACASGIQQVLIS